MKCELSGRRGCLHVVENGDVSEGRRGAGDEGTGRNLRAIGKMINWSRAAEILGVRDRQMRRLRERYEEHGL